MMIDALSLEYRISFPTIRYDEESGTMKRTDAEIRIPVKHTDRLNDAISEVLFCSRTAVVKHANDHIVEFRVRSLKSPIQINSELPKFHDDLLQYEWRNTNNYPIVLYSLEKNSESYAWMRYLT